MTDFPLDVPAHEHDRLRLFGLDTSSPEGAAVRDAVRAGDSAALGRALGVERVEADRVELIATRDVAELGLAGYLAAGYDVPRDQLGAASPELSAAPAHVLSVPSSAFGGQAQTLSPGPALTPLAAFDLADPMPPRAPMPRHPDPEASLASPAGAPAPADRKPPRRTGLLLAAAAALIVLILVIWALT